MADYLITGGCGFIGSHLCDALSARGDRVRILDNLSAPNQAANRTHGVELLIGDVTDEAIVSRAMEGMDGCFHLAAVSSVVRSNMEWVATHRTNLTGTITVLDAARRAKPGGPIPVIYASSAAVYGDNPDQPLSETAVARPLSAYGVDKLGCELYARVAGAVHKVPTLGLRLFNVYGPRQNPNSLYSGVISIFANRLRNAMPVTIHGDGRQERDFVYVGDVVRALRMAIGKASTDGRVYNVCSGNTISICDLAKTIANTFNAPLVLEFGPARSADIRRSIGNPEAIQRALGWRAEFAFAEGLQNVMDAL